MTYLERAIDLASKFDIRQKVLVHRFVKTFTDVV